jgi:anti-sigma-K factor RskA
MTDDVMKLKRQLAFWRGALAALAIAATVIWFIR